ncbi:MAG TPA: hypothetical protein VN879_15985 [Candidatus Acidoferrales bacterium]|nr:hypothetical protein [Candidatus Acidoferrales bacterium]
MASMTFKGKAAAAVLDALSNPPKPTKAERVAKELCDAAEAFQDAANQLWWAQNPDERDGVPPSEEHAMEVHSERFQHLTASIYEVRKAFGFPTAKTGNDNG